MITIAGFDVSLSYCVLGLITGTSYGLLGVGLVLVYRANRVVNFAHAQIGGVSALLLGVGVVRWNLPYWLAFLLILAVAAILGSASEAIAIRRLRNAPRVTSLVATLGIGAVLAGVGGTLAGMVPGGAPFPQPPGLPKFNVGALLVTPAYSGLVILSPALVAMLVYFLGYTRNGRAMRAAAANALAARMAGVRSARTSSIAWAIAGMLSAFTAVFTLPAQGFAGAADFAPQLLLRALAPAVVARMRNMPAALVSGIVLGVIEQELLLNYPSGGVVDFMLFCVILVALLLQRRIGGRAEELGSWTAARSWPPLPDAYYQLRSIRLLRPATVIVLLGLGVVIGEFVLSNSATVTAAQILAVGLVAVSVGIVTGQAGQLTLGQFALAGVGATAFYWTTTNTHSPIVGLAGAGVAGAAVAVVIGLPALRIRGVMLAVCSLAFALAASEWILDRPNLLGTGRSLEPIFSGSVLGTAKGYYLWTLGVFALGVLIAANVRRAGLGRNLVALRDNEAAARSFGVSALRRTLQAFAISGFLAGLGGAVFAGTLLVFTGSSFSVDLSIDSAAGAVLGGLGTLSGPLIGVAYIFGVPAFVPLNSAAMAGTALGWLLVIMYLPSGLAALVRPVRDVFADGLARLAGLDVRAERDVPVQETALPDISLVLGRSSASTAAGRIEARVGRRRGSTVERDTEPVGLVGENLSKSYGGIRAVDDVSIEVKPGETLGLIGSNGAGKTTLFELLSGFVHPTAGRVLLGGRDITGLTPERRTRMGLVRSFQDAALFSNSTVLDVLRLAQERHLPTNAAVAIGGDWRAERKRDARARQVLSLMGLDRFRDRAVGDLSTGTRRITELACVFSLGPSIVLLDEPSSGIAQRETEALAEVIARIRSALGLTMIVIEHDMPFIMGLVDRVVVMESGRVIASGPPAQIQQDPAVIEAYLGGNQAAIARSGVISNASV